jgi:hypothetical protein
MSLTSGKQLILTSAAGGGGYAISRSLRFNSADSAYLSRTPASAGNRKTWTWAGWVKRSRTAVSNTEILFQGGPGSSGNDSNYYVLRFDGSDRFDAITWNGAARKLTTQVFRDCSAWYHIVFAFDTTQATAANRHRLYVNGTEVTTFTTDSAPSQNTDYGINAAVAHNIGREEYTGGAANAHFSGYLADIHFIDGQALDPTSFGEFSATTGVWVPKAYSGPAATGNSFWLPFSDNSAATATTLGKDNFNLGNNWTPSNLSVTAGAGNDSLIDVPVNGSEVDTGLGGQVRGNYCTWNILKKGAAITDVSNGNLDWLSTTVGSNYTSMILGTIGVSSGKWYWENTVGSLLYVGIGIATDLVNLNTYPGGDAYSWSYLYNGVIYNNGSVQSYGATFTTGDVIGVALDLDAGTLTFYKNGITQGVAYSGLSGPTYFPMSGDPNSSTNGSLVVNFGQRQFAYTAPSGFKALNTANLPAPVVTKPSDLFDVKLYTGNGSTQTVSGLGFSPDLVWIKARNTTNAYQIFDTVRGASIGLSSNTTDADSNNAPYGLTSFGASSFNVNDISNGGYGVNGSSLSQVYAAWCWDAGNTTVTNTQGSITGGSQVRANATAGFSIVTYTGTGSAATVGHGLGVAPSMIIVKSRNTGSTNWGVYHVGVSSTPQNSALNLDNTAAIDTQSVYWNNTAPTSTVFSVGTWGGSNGSTRTYVAYCFAPVVGYSSFGSYTGNGSADGPFVYTGFRPRWVMVKCSSSDQAGNADWRVQDSTRSSYNVVPEMLFANLSIAESTGNALMDFTSNGFKLRNTSSGQNASGATYIYAAFAESCFAVNNRAR